MPPKVIDQTGFVLFRELLAQDGNFVSAHNLDSQIPNGFMRTYVFAAKTQACDPFSIVCPEAPGIVIEADSANLNWKPAHELVPEDFSLWYTRTVLGIFELRKYHKIRSVLNNRFDEVAYVQGVELIISANIPEDVGVRFQRRAVPVGEASLVSLLTAMRLLWHKPLRLPAFCPSNRQRQPAQWMEKTYPLQYSWYRKASF